METKRRFSRYLNYIRRKKDAKLAFFYSVFYFLFITLLLAYGSITNAQQQHNYKMKDQHHKIVVPSVEDIEIAIYNTGS